MRQNTSPTPIPSQCHHGTVSPFSQPSVVFKPCQSLKIHPYLSPVVWPRRSLSPMRIFRDQLQSPPQPAVPSSGPSNTLPPVLPSPPSQIHACFGSVLSPPSTCPRLTRCRS